MPDATFHILGVNAGTGHVLDGALTDDVLKNLTSQQSIPDGADANKADASAPHLGTDDDTDPSKLEEAGWGIIFAPSVTQAIQDALQPLIARRKQQVGDDRLFKIFAGDDGYQKDDTAATWLARKKVRLDTVTPLKGVPFYILIVGSPEEIPFEFQYGLDLYWGVGRLWFDKPDQFRQYADSVVQYETMPAVPTTRKLTVFATKIPKDEATADLISALALPMTQGTTIKGPFGQKQNFKIEQYLGDPATKANLSNILASPQPPAVLFTGAHGMDCNAGTKLQDEAQGAIVCQDWPGGIPPQRKHYLPAADVPDNAKIHGMVHFMFGCYSAGWPKYDTYRETLQTNRIIAPTPGVARLPQALLSHKDGAALAVLGHVDQATASAFETLDHTSQIEGFRSVMNRIMSGNRLGQATDQFNLRWAGLSVDLVTLLQRQENKLPVDPNDLKQAWLARDDARNYVLYGDPAVQLRTDAMPQLS